MTEKKLMSAEELKANIAASMAEQQRKIQELYTQLMALCTGSDSFYFVDHEKDGDKWLRVFTYRLASYSDFLLPGATEARGIMFEVWNLNGVETPTAIKSRPPAKFFNIGENPLTLELDYSKVIHSVIKEDGSLISTFHTAIWGMGEDFESQLHWSLRLKSKTSTSSQQVKDAMAWLETQPEFRDKLLELDIAGVTVNCEWCAPDNRIVVGYMEPRLIVLNARSRVSGLYVQRHVLEQIFGDHLVKTATPVKGPEDLKELATHTGYEGLILQFEEDYKVQFVKFKNDWYLHRHRTKDSVNNANALFDCVLNEGSDDLRTMFVEDPLATKIIDDMEALVIPLYNRFVKGCQNFYNENKHLERKDYAIKGQQPFFEEGDLLNKFAFGIVMTMYLGKDPDIKGTLSKYKRLWTKVEDND